MTNENYSDLNFSLERPIARTTMPSDTGIMKSRAITMSSDADEGVPSNGSSSPCLSEWYMMDKKTAPYKEAKACQQLCRTTQTSRQGDARDIPMTKMGGTSAKSMVGPKNQLPHCASHTQTTVAMARSKIRMHSATLRFNTKAPCRCGPRLKLAR